MKEIIPPVGKELLKQELTPEKKLRDTNKGHNEIYVVTWQDSPNIVREIGRLREVTFRDAGGGTGKELDLDEFDTMEVPYKQLIVWDPDAEAILGGYRYLPCRDAAIDEKGQPVLATSHMFKFSEKFMREYMPYTLELGRSFVTPEYQSSKAGAKALFAMDNLWDGLGAVMFNIPEMKYYFGKMTTYKSYPTYAFDLIIYFLDKHFPDKERLIRPYSPIESEHERSALRKVLNKRDFKKDYKLLNAEIRNLGCNIPPLVNSYMNISPTMKVFGSAVNDEFGDVIETGILVTYEDIYDDKRARHIDSYIKERVRKIHLRFPRFVEAAGERLAERFKERREKIQRRIHSRKENRE